MKLKLKKNIYLLFLLPRSFYLNELTFKAKYLFYLYIYCMLK